MHPIYVNWSTARAKRRVRKIITSELAQVKKDANFFIVFF